MKKILTAGQRDKGVFALREVAKTMFGDPRRLNLPDLDEVQTILGGHGLIITHVDNVMEVEPKGKAAVPAQPPKPLTTDETHWLETLVAAYLDYKRKNLKGYLFTMDQVARLLSYCCRLAGIKFIP